MKIESALPLRAGALVLLALGGCAAPPAVRVDKVEGELPACRSFEWLPAGAGAASLTEQRLRAAVLARLQEKGYAQGDATADCRITYLLSVQESAQSKPSVGVGAGGGSGGVGGGIGISLPLGRKPRYSGTFTLDVVEVAKSAQVWSGSVDAALAAAEPSEEETRELVDAVLAKYPDAAR